MSGGLLPPPAELGLTVPGYYPLQEEMTHWVWCQDSRLVALSAPTGSGKSFVAGLQYLLSPDTRVMVLTGTKALQNQYGRQFGDNGLLDLRGKQNYPCKIEAGTVVAEAACQAGYRCPWMTGGCQYFDDVRAVQRGMAPFNVTNYSFWLSITNYTDAGLGPPPDVLVCDEADTLFDTLSEFLTFSITQEDSRRLLQADIPPADSEMPVIVEWAKRGQERIARALLLYSGDGRGQSKAARRRISELKRLDDELKRLTMLQGEWIPDWGERGSRRVPVFSIAPVWPVEYIEPILYHGAKKVVLMSATLPEETVKLLQGGREYVYRDFPSTIPVADRPIIHIPTAQMRRSAEDYQTWLTRIDQIIEARRDRRVLVHTTSYGRRNRVMEGSRHRGAVPKVLISHGSQDIEEAVAEFKHRPPPAALISPSLTRGYDFPGTDCEVVVIGKIPYPDTRSKVVQARTARWKDYPAFTAMQTIQQEAGRATRYVGDRAEILLIDDDWKWFWPKYRQYATKWFADAVQGSSSTIPKALPKL